MTIRRLGGPDSPEPSPSPKRTRTSLSSPEKDPNLDKIITAVTKAVRESQAAREKELSPELKARVTKLEKGLEKLSDQARKLCTLSDQSNKIQDELLSLSSGDEASDEIQEKRDSLDAEYDRIDENIQKAELNIQTTIQDLIEENHELSPSKDQLTKWPQLNRIEKDKREISIAFMQEQVINRCKNRVSFSENTKRLIAKHKHEILSKFYVEKIQESELAEIDFSIEIPDSETHNGGKIPSKLSFSRNGSFLFSVFYKPRDATIDKKVIDLFDQMNQLPTNEKSSNIKLPTYKIENFDENGESFSIWEFIDGKQETNYQAPSEFVKSISDTHKRKHLEQQLSRLNSVCEYAGISDLNPENVIFRNLDTEHPEIIPIDLESIQPGQATGLFPGKPTSTTLTESEKQLLETFQKATNDIPFRVVPVATSHFLGGLSSCESFLELGKDVLRALKESKFIPSIDITRMEYLILNDLLHNDVPYFTKYKSQLYYGLVENKNIIAEISDDNSGSTRT